MDVLGSFKLNESGWKGWKWKSFEKVDILELEI
jgi:hypothetical protein